MSGQGIKNAFKGDNSKRMQVEQLFLHATHCLDLIYMPTKYYQNISVLTSFGVQTDRHQNDPYIPRSLSAREIKKNRQTSSYPLTIPPKESPALIANTDCHEYEYSS